jgi:hypothetical protein
VNSTIAAFIFLFRGSAPGGSMRITSFQNEQIKNVVKLHKRRERDRQNKFVVEGYRAIHYALENDYSLHELYYCPELFLGKN